jgi:hypothetical protein
VRKAQQEDTQQDPGERARRAESHARRPEDHDRSV